MWTAFSQVQQACWLTTGTSRWSHLDKPAADRPDYRHQEGEVLPESASPAHYLTCRKDGYHQERITPSYSNLAVDVRRNSSVTRTVAKVDCLNMRR
ncbi:hypothetical protein NPIL_168031 [Nephila pilipes]|uniref:Uncharacterized protein n=1 Tax=Nephila pilipes TaxID=299642 RepID=A0A8X6MTV8_NEPPI|nr:hypothetical protein NPIL_168031 [Nephila pilipes]